MADRQHISGPARHDRLFELIRQENLIRDRELISPFPTSTNLNEMQNFLKQAHRSLVATDGYNIN